MTDTQHDNIILVTYDSVRADHCSYTGYERETTPNLDYMANEGIAFHQAISPASRTNPSMSGIMTGEPLVNREKVSDPEISRDHINRYGTIAEALSEKGYRTAAFCPNAYASRHYGFDRGFDHFEDFLFTSDLYQSLFSKHISDSGVFTALRNFRNLIRKEEAFRTWDTYIDDVIGWANSQDEPFFIWIFALDTHYPYVTPRKDREWSNSWKTFYYNYKCNSLINEFDVSLSDTEKQGIVDIYDDALRYGDKMLGELRNRLSSFDPTYVVHADHGEAFDEHGFYGHFFPSLYEECTRVPLVVWNEDTDQETISEPFSLLQLPNVLRAIADSDLESIGETSPSALSTTYDGRRDRNLVSYHVGDYKVLTEVQDDEASTEVYDISRDPEEESPIEGSEQFTSELGNLADSRLAHEDEQIQLKEAVGEVSSNLDEDG